MGKLSRGCVELTRRTLILPLWLLILSLLGLTVAPANAVENGRVEKGQPSKGEKLVQREFSPLLDGSWIGNGISYGPYREGQSPNGAGPSREELTEDLQILRKHWKLLRMYGTGAVTEEVLKVIKEEKLPMRVMLGAWIANETASDNLDDNVAKIAKRANETQVKDAIRLANSYPDQVIAISVGNETQVFWSDHLTKREVLIGYIKQVREATSVPVTTADDFNFWNKPESKAVAAEVDFIFTHIHAMWAGLLPSTAMQWTKKTYDEVCDYHPQKMVVIGEAGWATQVHTEGEQAKLIKGSADEAAQRRYYREFTDWADQEKICTFFFEAFDEPWKGGPHPNEVEKHWGVLNVDRTPKSALRDGE